MPLQELCEVRNLPGEKFSHSFNLAFHPAELTIHVRRSNSLQKKDTFIRMKEPVYLDIPRTRAYVIFTAIFFIFWFLFKMGGMPNAGRALVSAAVDIGITVASMLISVEYLLPRFFYPARYLSFTLYFLLLIFAGGSAIILTQLFLHGSSLTDYPKNVARYNEHYFYWFWADLIFGSYFLVFFISATGAAIRLSIDRLKTMHQVSALEQEKTVAELEALKNQLNPHFLFNAMNTIYYKIDRSNTLAREMLGDFSEMLRYQLYECNRETVPIQKELQFLQSYVELQKARLSENYVVSYTVTGDAGTENSIAPFLFLPLIENCFKFVSNYSGRKNEISISIDFSQDTMLLETVNSFDPDAEKSAGGIGLANVKRRLELLYPGNYSFETGTSGNLFTVKLKIGSR